MLTKRRRSVAVNVRHAQVLDVADRLEVVEAIDGGGMPPLQYKLIHGNSRLSDAEKRELIAGFRKLYASDPPPIGGGD